MKKYVMIFTTEDERYPDQVDLSFYSEHPWEGNLVDIVQGDSIEELYQSAKDKKGESYEGLFFQCYETETGKRISSGIFDPDSPREELEEYEKKIYYIPFAYERYGYIPVKANDLKKAFCKAEDELVHLSQIDMDRLSSVLGDSLEVDWDGVALDKDAHEITGKEVQEIENRKITKAAEDDRWKLAKALLKRSHSCPFPDEVNWNINQECVGFQEPACAACILRHLKDL